MSDLVEIPRKEPEILVGTLREPYRIDTNKGRRELTEWRYRAMWSFLRLQCGRSIDKEIRDYIEREGRLQHDLEYVEMSRDQRAELMEAYFAAKVASTKMSRPVQFILDGQEIRAVASLKHLLIPPMEVYDMARTVVAEKHPSLVLSEQEGLTGLTYEIEEYKGFNLGLQIFGGDIYTRQAITLSSWLRVLSCFNPLSWLGSGSFHSIMGKGVNGHERMLRIKKRSELEPRFIEAVEAQLKKTQDLKGRVEETKKVKVKRSEAEVIMSALGLSYSLGADTVEQILKRLQKEDKTQWGMAMASSWVAEHGKFRLTKGESKRVQKLSTISGAALLLRDIQDAEEKSLAWLQGHIKRGESKTLDELAEMVKLWEKKRK